MADPVLLKNALFSYSTSTSAAYAELDACKSLSIDLSKAELPNSVMGDNLETFYPGLTAAPIESTHRNDFGASGVDVKAWTLWNAGNKGRIKIRAVDSAVSSTNPSYIVAPVYLVKITPINGAHGELLENRLRWVPASGASVTRSTST